MKIDTIRIQIEIWKKSKEIGDNLYYFLLASLLESADKMANTTSVYGAYLKYLKQSAKKQMMLVPAFFELNNNNHQVFNKDSNQLIKEINGDILYLDPPYNQRQYGSNYHLLNTILLSMMNLCQKVWQDLENILVQHIVGKPPLQTDLKH
jgi:adenine-specific DNA-methyltransferase